MSAPREDTPEWQRGDRVQIGDRPLILFGPGMWGTVEKVTGRVDGEPVATVRLNSGALRDAAVGELRPATVGDGDRVRHLRNHQLPLGTAGISVSTALRFVTWGDDMRTEMEGDLVPVNISYLGEEPATEEPATEEPAPQAWQLRFADNVLAEGTFTTQAMERAARYGDPLVLGTSPWEQFDAEAIPRLRRGDRLTLQLPDAEPRTGTVTDAWRVGRDCAVTVLWEEDEPAEVNEWAEPDLHQGDRVQWRDQEDHGDLPPLQGTIERVTLRAGGSTAEVDWDNGHQSAEARLTELRPAPVAEGSLVRATPDLLEALMSSGALTGRVTAILERDAGANALVLWSARTTLTEADRLQPIEEPPPDPPPLQPGERVNHLNPAGVPDGENGTVVELAGDRVLVDWDDGNRSDVGLDRLQRQPEDLIPEVQVRRGGVTYATPDAQPAGGDAGSDIPAVPSQGGPAATERTDPPPEVGELVQVRYHLPGGSPRSRGRLLDVQGGRCLVEWSGGVQASYPAGEIERAPFRADDRAQIPAGDGRLSRATVTAWATEGGAGYELMFDDPGQSAGALDWAGMRHLPPERDLPEPLRPGGQARTAMLEVLQGLGLTGNGILDQLADSVAPWVPRQT